jgi:hypothetical protein
MQKAGALGASAFIFTLHLNQFYQNRYSALTEATFVDRLRPFFFAS